jgi:hypothetical protein
MRRMLVLNLPVPVLVSLGVALSECLKKEKNQKGNGQRDGCLREKIMQLLIY